MTSVKPSSTKPVDEWADYRDDPDCEWIEYREPTTSQVNIPGQGPTTVQDNNIHRVPLAEWPAYEKRLHDAKKGL